jgi:hypothetical protein
VANLSERGRKHRRIYIAISPPVPLPLNHQEILGIIQALTTIKAFPGQEFPTETATHHDPRVRFVNMVLNYLWLLFNVTFQSYCFSDGFLTLLKIPSGSNAAKILLSMALVPPENHTMRMVLPGGLKNSHQDDMIFRRRHFKVL